MQRSVTSAKYGIIACRENLKCCKNFTKNKRMVEELFSGLKVRLISAKLKLPSQMCKRFMPGVQPVVSM